MDIPSSTVFQVQLNWESPPIFFYIRSGLRRLHIVLLSILCQFNLSIRAAIATGYLSFLYRLSVDYQLKLKEILTLHFPEHQWHIYSQYPINFQDPFDNWCPHPL